MVSNILRNELCVVNNKRFPKLIFFTGKGGVGKTTCSSALGDLLSKLGNYVMIISTDPAHSLGDSFNIKLSKGIITTPYPNNKLYLLELSMDPPIKNNYSPKNSFISDIFFPSSEEYIIMSEIVSVLLKIVSSNLSLDYVIFDMAPSGHSLRLLQLPNKMKNYISKITRISNSLIENTELINEEQKKDQLKQVDYKDLAIKRLYYFHNILINPNLCQYIIVGIAEYMSYIESVKLNSEFEELGINCENIIINKLEFQNNNSVNCKFCKSRQENQKKMLNMFQEKFKNKKIISIPLSISEITGISQIEKIEDYLKDIL